MANDALNYARRTNNPPFGGLLRLCLMDSLVAVEALCEPLKQSAACWRGVN